MLQAGHKMNERALAAALGPLTATNSFAPISIETVSGASSSRLQIGVTFLS